MSKPTYVLGTGLSHNGSACLLKDGKIVVAIEKERVTRIKNDGFNDVDAINYCLEAEGVSWADIDLVVQNSVFSNFEHGNDWYYGLRNIPESVECITISHHHAHAYSALFLSPFEEASIVVVDGAGSPKVWCTDIPDEEFTEADTVRQESISYYTFRQNQLVSLHKQFSFCYSYHTSDKPIPAYLKDSIGGFYDGANYYVFKCNNDVGQLMGLSAYGKNSLPFGTPYAFDGMNLKWDYSWVKELKKRNPMPDHFDKNFQYFADLAKFTQDNVSSSIVELLNKLHELSPNDNLCLAGGVGFNIIANSRIVKDTPFKNLYVPPPANDAGIAIGCAYYGWHVVMGRDRVKHNGSPYLGMAYDEHYGQVIDLVTQVTSAVEISKPENLNELVAKLIAGSNTVGWYKGGAEIGPRALGHRSILGNPCNPNVREYINNEIKNRPDFRPFAPAVLAEDASIYFDIDRPSPYMLMVFPVREEWRDKIPAVTHVDGTARVQTVSETDNKDFYELLKEVKKETGIGMVLNTSFNERHEPIVERPDDAVQMFLKTPMDALVLGPYLLKK